MDITVQKNRGFLQSMLCLYIKATIPQIRGQCTDNGFCVHCGTEMEKSANAKLGQKYK